MRELNLELVQIIRQKLQITQSDGCVIPTDNPATVLECQASIWIQRLNLVCNPWIDQFINCCFSQINNSGIRLVLELFLLTSEKAGKCSSENEKALTSPPSKVKEETLNQESWADWDTMQDEVPGQRKRRSAQTRIAMIAKANQGWQVYSRNSK